MFGNAQSVAGSFPEQVSLSSKQESARERSTAKRKKKKSSCDKRAREKRPKRSKCEERYSERE